MILCCGEALIDMLPRMSRDGAGCFQPFPGGSVFNTAVSIGRLGTPVGLLTGLSTDLFGKQLEQHLADSKVDTTFALRSDRPTTLAFVMLTDGQARYAFYDENTAGRMLDVADLPDIPSNVNLLFFGGISLMVEPAAQTYETLLLRGAETHPVMLDPNIRPGFIRDEAVYRARLDRLLAACSMVKVSDEDLHWISGAGELDDCAAALRAKGPQILCVTEGAKGVRVYFDGGMVQVPATRVTIADTVGAGDTFNGGFLSALHKMGATSHAALRALSSDQLEQAAGVATRAAAITVAREGADPPWAQDMS